MGGAAGWYYGKRLWRLRGFIDLLVGGVGARRGRRDPEYGLPFHLWIFRGMLARIADAAQAPEEAPRARSAVTTDLGHV
jgi:hypothetical protein